MQILYESSEEGAGEGLGLFPGRVRRLRHARLPHIGWNSVRHGGHAGSSRACPGDAYFYFVHSFAPSECSDPCVATTDYGDRFASAVGRARTSGPSSSTPRSPATWATASSRTSSPSRRPAHDHLSRDRSLERPDRQARGEAAPRASRWSTASPPRSPTSGWGSAREWLHVVDLNAALGEGKPTCRCSPVRSQAAKTPRSIQWGGGRPRRRRARAAARGGRRRGRSSGRRRSGLGLAGRGRGARSRAGSWCRSTGSGREIMIDGWQETSGVDAVEFIAPGERAPAGRVPLHERRGRRPRRGRGLDAGARRREAATNPVVFSGGVTTIDDVARFKELGAYGIIAGSALYKGGSISPKRRPSPYERRKAQPEDEGDRRRRQARPRRRRGILHRLPDKWLKHMLESVARFGKFDLEIKASGDFNHHIVEDVALRSARRCGRRSRTAPCSASAPPRSRWTRRW